MRHSYSKTSNISRTLVGNKIVDNSDVVEASPVGAAPTTSSFSTKHLASMDWAKTTAQGGEKHLSWEILCDLYKRFYGILYNNIILPAGYLVSRNSTPNASKTN